MIVSDGVCPFLRLMNSGMIHRGGAEQGDERKDVLDAGDAEFADRSRIPDFQLKIAVIGAFTQILKTWPL